MEYSNPRVPEGINVTPEHPLKAAAQLVAGIAVVVVLTIVALAYGAGMIARRVPFELEQSAAAEYESVLSSGDKEARHAKTEHYLQGLADRLAQAQSLPAPMKIRVHYVDDATINAMATLGGHVIIFRGLLAIMPSENALAMVLSHEVAHIKHRDPIVALGRGVVIGFGLAALGLTSGQDAASSALGQAGLLTQLTFSREQERAADREALHALAKVYGHVQGSDTAFEELLKAAEPATSFVPEILSTHPDTQARIEALRQLAKAEGMRITGSLTPIPSEIAVVP